MGAGGVISSVALKLSTVKYTPPAFFFFSQCAVTKVCSEASKPSFRGSIAGRGGGSWRFCGRGSKSLLKV